MQVLMCNLKETQRSTANKKSQRRFQQIVDFNVDKKNCILKRQTILTNEITLVITASLQIF